MRDIKKYFLFLTGMAGFFCFSQNADINMLRKINSDSSAMADHGYKFLSNSVTPVAFITPSSMLLAGCLDNNNGNIRNGYKTALSIFTAGILGTSLKLIVKRERPFKKYDFIRQKDKVGPFSFPSNHTCFAFATATSLTLAYPQWNVAVPAYLWAGLVAYSRMYLGVHFPSDLLGGMVIGIGASVLVWEVDHLLNGK